MRYVNANVCLWNPHFAVAKCESSQNTNQNHMLYIKKNSYIINYKYNSFMSLKERKKRKNGTDILLQGWNLPLQDRAAHESQTVCRLCFLVRWNYW